MKKQNKTPKTRKEHPLLGRILQKIAPQIGATVFLESEWHIAGQITFKSGNHSYFRYSTLDLNPMGASEIARDKDYANLFMERLGYPIVPKSHTFFSDKWGELIGAPERDIEAAYKYANSIGFPVCIKPNNGSQGRGVRLVYNKDEFYEGLRDIFASDNVGIVQAALTGRDYRIVVLDDEIISAYERIPLNVTGDGKSTIHELLTKKQAQFELSKRDTCIKYNDSRIPAKLKRIGYTFETIPDALEQVFLLDNANLSAGGDPIDVTRVIHQEFKEFAIKLTKDMGLRLCGVDLMVQGDISTPPEKYWVLEINSAPGLDHYICIGEEQEKIVENLYLTVLKHLEH